MVNANSEIWLSFLPYFMVKHNQYRKYKYKYMYYGVSIDISIIFLIIFSCCLMYKFLKKMFLFEDDNREIISAK